MKRALAGVLLALVAGCTPDLVKLRVDVKNRSNEERMIWLAIDGQGEAAKDFLATRSIGLVEPLRLGTFDIEVREDVLYRIVATDRSGEPSKPLHSTEQRRPKDGETVEVVVER